MQRCCNPNSINYKNYGGRGIGASDIWLGDYLAFKSYVLEVLGERPTPNHSIDRIDNNKGYYPGNLKWATAYEQMTNKRTSKLNKEDVLEIKWLLSLGYSGVSISRDYNVGEVMISQIKTGVSHAEV